MNSEKNLNDYFQKNILSFQLPTTDAIISVNCFVILSLKLMLRILTTPN